MGNDAEYREKISANVIATFNAKQDECKTSDDLIKEIDNGRTQEIKNLISKKESMQHHYFLVRDKCKNDFETKKELEELKERLKNKSSETVRYVYEESSESIYYRQQMQIENQNRQTAEEELPNSLSIVKKDFFRTLNDKVFNIKNNIENELLKYSPDNLKILFQKISENEKIENNIIEYVQKLSEKILEKSYKSSDHFNGLLLGKTGVGKSTLINGAFGFKENEGAKTGAGEPITKEFGEYVSQTRKGLRLIDSQGIELKGHNIEAVFNSTKKLIEDRAREGDPDKFIHCIWYCFKSSGLRFEACEKEFLTLLMNQYYDNKLPIIIVITQNYIEEDTEIMIDYLKKEFQFLNREITIIPVVAKKKNIGNKKNELFVNEAGIDELIKESFEKSQKAVLPALMKSIEEKIIKIFSQRLKFKKNKLKKDLEEVLERILKKIKEKDPIEKSISKISILFSKTLNIFFEFAFNNEENLENYEIKEIEEKDEEEEEKKENLENIANEDNMNNIENNLDNHGDNDEEEKKENMEEINNEVPNENKEVEELKAEEELDQNQEQNQEQNEQIQQNEDNKENEEQNQELNQENNQQQIEEEEKKEEEKKEESDEEEEEVEEEEGAEEEEIEQNEIVEKNQNEIKTFLDDLCKWFIERLNDIISDLIRANSNDLGKLLFKEQVKVKQNHNVKTTLNNEQSIDQCITESELNLKPKITNKVYYSGLKDIYSIISKNLLDVGDLLIQEKFDKILPELKNYISDNKLKKISNEKLEKILKNN